MTRPQSPRIYRALNAISRELCQTGLAKSGRNQASGYAFRSIDDIYNRLGPLLVKHRLCVLPQVTERVQHTHRTSTGELIFSVSVRAGFEFISAADGSRHLVETWGEGMDAGDKGTAKAMTAAYKTAILQTFCIPVTGEEDGDAATPPKLTFAAQTPVQGWGEWAKDLEALIDGCATIEAIERVQQTYRDQLRALSLAEPELYCQLGGSIQRKRARFSAVPERRAA